MKEVKNSLSKEVKENFYLTILNLLKEGKNPAKISKQLNLSKQKLNYYLSMFKKKGLVEKRGYGVWEVKVLPPKILTHIHSKEIRGHAFIWTIKIPKEMKGVKEEALKIGKEMNKGQVRLIVKDHKVWIGKKNIVIYENKSFYGKNAIESRKYAVINLIEVLKELEKKLDIKLKPYIFKPCKEHYGMIKNDLAVQCNRNKEKILVHDDLEGEWLWIDDSESLGELEVSGTKAIVRSKQVQEWWNDQKKHNFEVTSSFILDGFSKMFLINQQLEKQIASHLKLIQEYRKENIKWRETTEKRIVKENKEQKNLFEF